MNDFVITHVPSSVGELEYKPAIRNTHRGRKKNAVNAQLRHNEVNVRSVQ